MKPYEYQKAVATYLLNPNQTQRRNVILQAPTGAGKTQAALLPFLNAIQHKREFPHRCIYSVPMRILANQFVTKYQSAINKAGFGKEIPVAIQTGDNPQSREFTHNLIFATIDQTLSSFLMAPYGLPTRLANLNAGAILSSYLVFDEFHLYDPNTTLPTTLYMLKQLKGITPFLLMTATFGKDMLDSLADELDAVVVPEDDYAMKKILSIQSQNKTRRYHTIDAVLSAESVLQEHKRRSLVICNQVDRARHLYRELTDLSSNEVEVILLHSRFLPDDRKNIEDRIRDLFAEGIEDGNYIVVSTPAIEVGVDITSTALHTELAPANAIVQRAGRCARYQGEEGDVYIYRYVVDLKGESEDGQIDLYDMQNKSDVLPYRDQEDVFRKTWEQFNARNSNEFTYQDELAVISQAHGATDTIILNQLKAGAFAHSREIHDVQNTSDKAHAKNLIRDIFQQNVFIHDNPESFMQDVLNIQSISLHPYTLQGYIKKWVEQDPLTTDWVVKCIYDIHDEVAMQVNEDKYRIDVIRNDSEVTKALGARLVVVHPAYASYSITEGFVAEYGIGDKMPLPGEMPSADNGNQAKYKGYRKETYEEHIRLVYQAFEEQWHDVAWGAEQMERKFGWGAGVIRRAAELAVLLHDVGKLSVKWQAWAQNYQQALFIQLDDSKFQPDASEAYAHTDFNYSEKQREIQRSIQPSRPWHAVESAMAVYEILIDVFDETQNDLFMAVYSAIARHHAPTSSSHGGFKLHQDAIRHIQVTLPDDLQDLDLKLLDGLEEEIGAEQADDDMARSYENKAFLAYCLLVRALRHADQEGTKRGSE